MPRLPRGNNMSTSTQNYRLQRKLDGILDVLYDASDVPYLHRKSVGDEFADDIEGWIEHAVDEHMEGLPDPTNDLQDIESRIAKVEETLDAIQTILKER